ncbi:MAG: BlaI/MecI/CopY family transcriptional regulator [Pseudomonadota bacterium]
MDVRLSEAEWEVMEVLWASPQPLTATDIDETLSKGDRNWSLATVKSLLSRLLAKQAVAPAKDGRRFLYSPAIERSACVARESRRLMDRLFGGRLSPLIAQLADDEPLAADDVAAIEKLLREMKA